MQLPRPRRLVVLVVVLALLVSGAVVGRLVWQHHQRSDLARALEMLPADSLRVGFTDWAGVRRELGEDPGRRPSGAVVRELVEKAYDTDLSAASSIDESAAALQDKFGFSPATVAWEAYAQSRVGAAMVVRLPDDHDFKEQSKTLRGLGYRAPSRETGVWRGGADVVSSIDPTITPELQYVVLLPDQHLLVSSDAADQAARVAKVASGTGRSLADSPAIGDLVDQVGAAANAMVWAGDFVCSDLAMSQADADDQARADQLVRAAGGVSPMNGMVMAMSARRTLTVAQHFETDAQARRNLRPRARLAVGEAVGRGGSFADTLRLTGSRADRASVVLTWRAKRRTGYVLSALYDGPVLFATC